MRTYQQVLKALAEDGPTYENWIQYQELARAAAQAWRSPKEKTANKLHTRFYELANLKDFTHEQLVDGLELPDLTWSCDYKWSSQKQEWIYD